MFAELGRFVGYGSKEMEYRILDKTDRNFYRSDVYFNEVLVDTHLPRSSNTDTGQTESAPDIEHINFAPPEI